MSFFTKTDGTAVKKTKTVEVGGFQKLIPEGTQLQCAIAAAVWAPEDSRNAQHVDITLHVTEQGDYRNFKVHHKLHVLDPEAKKRDRSLDMLMAYDENCKGELQKADAAGVPLIGNNTLLARALNGGQVVATFDVWETENQRTGEMMSGNWVRAIQPMPKKEQEIAASIEAKAQTQQPVETYREPGSDDDFGDDIDF